MNTNKKHRFSIHLISPENLSKGDFFFLCTDGVLENVTNKMLCHSMGQNDLVEAIAKKIILQSNRKTWDNFTFQIIKV